MSEGKYDADFPRLKATGYRRTSEPADYNCIAFAAWDEANWWWPSDRPDEYWPVLPVPPVADLEAFTAAYATRGFRPCRTGKPEPGYDKVALYGVTDGSIDRLLIRHAARLADGDTAWKSKLGPEEDIEHTLEGLVGPCYGAVVGYLRRPTPNYPAAPEPPGMFARLSTYVFDKAHSLLALFRRG
jgi:hypothetical protein